MRIWDIALSEQSEEDLRDIYEYIAFCLLEPSIAKNQVRRIKNAILKLDQMPERHSAYDKEPWKSRGLRRLNVDNYSVFYLPNDKQDTVVILRIVYSGRDIDVVLSDM